MAQQTTPDGLAQLKPLLDGDFEIPIGHTLGFRLVEAERGRVAVEGTPDKRAYNVIQTVHGGYLATLLDTACALALQSALDVNRGGTTLELKVSYVRALTVDSGQVRAVGRVISAGRRVAFAEAELHDSKGRLCATATSTLLVFDLPGDGTGEIRV